MVGGLCHAARVLGELRLALRGMLQQRRVDSALPQRKTRGRETTRNSEDMRHHGIVPAPRKAAAYNEQAS